MLHISRINDRPRTPRYVVVWLLVLVAFAAATRLVGLGAELPQTREPDTAIVHYAAWRDRPTTAPLTDVAYPASIYPFFLGGLLSVLPGANTPLPAANDAPLDAHLRHAAAPYLRARWLIALLSLLAVPATYLLARVWLSRNESLLAATFAATSGLALESAVMAKPHGALAGLGAWAALAAVRLVRNGSGWSYVGAAVTSALSVATLHSGCFIVPAVALAHWIGWRRDRDARRWWRFVYVVAACSIAFALSYPFILATGFERNVAAGTLDFGLQSIRFDSWNGGGFAKIGRAIFGHDPVLCGALLVGSIACGLALFRRRGEGDQRAGEAAVLAFHAAITVFAFGLQMVFYARYMLPLLSLMSVLAAAGVTCVVAFVLRAVRERRARCILVGASYFVVIALPAAVCVQVARVRHAPDTSTLAAQWLRDNGERVKGRIAVDFVVMMPLGEDREFSAAIPSWFWTPWMRYQAEIMPADAHVEAWPLRRIWAPGVFRDHKVDARETADVLAALNAHWIVTSVPSKLDFGDNAVRMYVREHAGEPVARFLGDRRIVDDWNATGVEPDFDFVNAALARDRLGPTIEIYAWP